MTAMGDDREECQLCKYFHIETTEQCRRYPPAASPNGWGDFPQVGKYDWCGEFKPLKDRR